MIIHLINSIVMSNTEITKAKKVKRIAAILYILLMAFIVGGSLLNQQKTESTQPESSPINPF